MNTWRRAGVTPIPRGEWYGRVFFAGEGRFCLLGPSEALLISPAAGGETKRLSFDEEPRFAVFTGDRSMALVAICDDLREFEIGGRTRVSYCVEKPPFLAAKSAEGWLFVGGRTVFRGDGEVLCELDAMPSGLFAGPVRSRPPAKLQGAASRETGPLQPEPVRSRPPANLLEASSREPSSEAFSVVFADRIEHFRT